MSKIRIKRRYRDYPPNVPKKLFRVLKANNFDRSKTAQARGVNSGYLSLLLNKGIEPPDTTVKGRAARKAMFLPARKERAIKEKRIRAEPEYLSKWRHLPTEERHTVIRQYIEWKANHATTNPS